MYYIYCYKNKLNGHKYVGQTNNIERRKREHLSSALNEKSKDYNSLFHSKIRQYGIENFDFAILEELNTEDTVLVDERERYWIDFEQSFVKNNGYNLTTGGQYQQQKQKIITKEQAKQIQQDLLNKVSYKEISKKYSIISSYISMINQGNYFYDETLNYPLQKFYKKDEEYQELVSLLKYSDLTLKQISEKLNIGYSTVKKINAGTLRHGLSDTYPIRDKSVYEIRADIVKNLLINTNLTKAEIMLQAKVSEETVRRINIGETHYDSNLTYPLR